MERDPLNMCLWKPRAPAALEPGKDTEVEKGQTVEPQLLWQRAQKCLQMVSKAFWKFLFLAIT